MKRAFVSLEEWKAAKRAGNAPADVALLKQYVPDSIKADGGSSRRVTFTISTGAVDRDRDTLKVDGWRLDNFRKNPVVLWGHQSRDLPIAVAESVGVASGQLKAVARFAEPGQDYDPADWPHHLPTPETVLRMLRGGFLHATSVGFIPLIAAWNEERMGLDVLEQELLEFSVVPVPANPEALQDAKDAGIRVEEIRAWAERVLDEFEPGLWVPREQAAAAFKVLSAPRVAVPPEFGKALDLVVAVTKRGRVLSQTNEALVRRARGGGADAVAALDELLSQLEQMPEEPDPDMPDMPEPEEPCGDGPKAADVHVIKLRPEPVEPRLPITPEEVRGATVAALEGLVAAQVRKHTGRLED